MFEHRKELLLPKPLFLRRVLKHVVLALAIVGASLAAGAIGYRVTERWSWTDSTMNAAMLLGGMGPVNEVRSEAGKVFATVYALYSGLVIIALVGVLLLPFMHRLLHRFHLEADEYDQRTEGS